MAGLDGIKNKIDPGEAMDKDLYDLPPEELEGIPTVCASLREAMDELEADMDFLLAGDVFTATRSRATWTSSGKRSTPSNTRRIRWNSRCTIAADPLDQSERSGRPFGAPFFV